VVLGLQQLDARSFWRDEVASVFFAQHPVGELATIIGRERDKVGLANMATYYLGLHFWLWLGETEARIRLLSVLAGAATVIPVYFLAKRLAGWTGGGAAAVIYAAHPFAIRYSQEARGYSMAMLAVAALTLILLVAIERRSPWWWAAYGVIAGLALYVHLFLLWTIGVHGLWVLATRNVPPWRSALAALVPLGLAAAPLPLIILQYGGGHGWIEGVNLGHVVGLLVFLGGGTLVLLVTSALAGVPTFLLRRDSRMWLLLALVLFPIVATAIVSLVKPLLLARYLIICVPPMAVLAGAGIALLRPRYLQAAAAVAVAAALVLALPSAYTDRHQQDWRSLAGWITTNATSGDMLAMQGWGQRSLQYYLDRDRVGDPLPSTSIHEVADGAPATRLWVVITVPSGRRASRALAPLEGRYVVAEQHMFGRKVAAFLLVPVAGTATGAAGVGTGAVWYHPPVLSLISSGAAAPSHD
jgi:mannosyltransferase